MADSRTLELFGRNLRRLREAHGYTLLEVGQAIGATPSQVSRFEAGHCWPRWPGLVDKFADLYCVTVSDIFRVGGAEEKAFALSSSADQALGVVNAMVKSGRVETRFVLTKA